MAETVVNTASSTKRRTGLVTPVYEAIKERIMDQAVAPGAPLNIDALAGQLQVSPTPVREALARLAAERLVTFEAFKGYFVMPLLTPRRLAELLHVRRLLEEDAARNAAMRIILSDLRAMERAIEAMESAHPEPRFRDFHAYNQQDQIFHERMIAAADNATLIETYRSLNVHIQLSRLYHNRGEIDYGESMLEHHAILEALKGRDPEAAARAVRTHINGVERRLGTLLEERDV